MGFEHVAQQVRSFLRPGIVPVTDFVAAVGFHQSRQRFGANPGVVVTGKMTAILTSLCHAAIIPPRALEERDLPERTFRRTGLAPRSVYDFTGARRPAFSRQEASKLLPAEAGVPLSLAFAEV